MAPKTPTFTEWRVNKQVGSLSSASLTHRKQGTRGFRVLTDVLDEHIFFLSNRCEGLSAVSLQTQDDCGSCNGRSHKHVVMTQVRFIVELVAGVTHEAEVDWEKTLTSVPLANG